jgi:hypothetical protein
MVTLPGWGLEHRASNPVSVKNLTAIETSTIVKLLRPYVPVGTKTSKRELFINMELQQLQNFLTKRHSSVYIYTYINCTGYRLVLGDWTPYNRH